MAKIQLHDVSMIYDARQTRLVNPLLGAKKEPLPDQTAEGVAALDHVNLVIPNGRTFVVVGPSGCGKSTLLRVIAGLVRNYTGQVLYDGGDMKDIKPQDRQIGMVFQNYALYPNFSSEGNLAFFFKVHDVPDEETRERIRYTSDLMGIGFKELLPRRPLTLSGGEQQRVALARAIVRAPRVLLLDEPLSNLDAKLRVQTRTEIKRLLRRFSITSLYVTHDQVEAIALADQIVVMRQGRIEQVGTYQDLMENPANVFVAGFLGLPPMNLFSGGFISGNKLVLDDYLIPVPPYIVSRAENNQSVTLGIRQEAVSISEESGLTAGMQLPAIVETWEADFVHRTQTVHMQTGRWSFSGLSPLDMKFRRGQLLYAQFDPESLYFFDTHTGLRIR